MAEQVMTLEPKNQINFFDQDQVWDYVKNKQFNTNRTGAEILKHLRNNKCPRHFILEVFRDIGYRIFDLCDGFIVSREPTTCEICLMDPVGWQRKKFQRQHVEQPAIIHDQIRTQSQSSNIPQMKQARG